MDVLVFYDFLNYLKILRYVDLSDGKSYYDDSVKAKFYKTSKFNIIVDHFLNYEYKEKRIVKMIKDDILNGDTSVSILYIINNVDYFKKYDYLVNAKKFDLI